MSARNYKKGRLTLRLAFKSLYSVSTTSEWQEIELRVIEDTKINVKETNTKYFLPCCIPIKGKIPP